MPMSSRSNGTGPRRTCSIRLSRPPCDYLRPASTDDFYASLFDRIKTMISYLNANGGIAGHQIKPVYVRVDSAAEFEQAGQVACTSLTQDNTVDMATTRGSKAVQPSSIQPQRFIQGRA